MSSIICIKDCYPIMWNESTKSYFETDYKRYTPRTPRGMGIREGEVFKIHEHYEHVDIQSSVGDMWKIYKDGFSNRGLLYFKKHFISLEQFRNNKIDEIL